MLVFKAN